MKRSAILEDLSHRTPGGIEDAAIAGLALRGVGKVDETLLRAQSSAGAWAAVPNGPPNTYLTALSLLALRHSREPQEFRACARSLQWLQGCYPVECHWLWKWKFRLVDRQVRFDPSKYGWPWVPGTVSWVAPTALTIVALRTSEIESSRIQIAEEMLLDRACPAGGWNAGNSSVFGVNLDPHPDFTAMALLALAGGPHVQSPIISSAAEYLSMRLETCQSAYSLAWGSLAFAALGDARATKYRRRLERMDARGTWPPRTLGLVALALEDPTFAFKEFAK
ncbi:MAG: hypothetical protein K2X35_21465 [Bryobacteraceae bacterium]|nr:hypothetical protein [Bryobacteraceae bacterium]